MVNALRGMKDTLSPENTIYEYFIEHCSRIAKNYGFEFIETPILEETALFKRSVGESSDIVGKEMYQFTDKGGNDVCMRPEGTAGVVRAFIQNKMDRAGMTRRFFYHGPMYRYERPQKGRLRQFHQFGAECFGESSVKEDAAVILMLKEMLDFLGIQATLKLNSLGNQTCMPSYRTKLVSFLDTLEGLCEDCERRKGTNPIRVLDCKNETCQTLLAPAPILIDNLCEECESEFNELKTILDRFHVPYEIDPKLVRGLDYYSKTAFEFVSDEIGAQSSIAGGGRYDRLVEFLDGRPTPGIGFAMGIERLMELIKMPETSLEGLYLGALSEEAVDVVYDIAIQKRATTKVLVDYKARGFNAHFKQADKKGVRYFACIGEEELASKSIRVKDLNTKEEVTLSLADFEERTW